MITNPRQTTTPSRLPPADNLDLLDRSSSWRTEGDRNHSLSHEVSRDETAPPSPQEWATTPPDADFDKRRFLACLAMISDDYGRAEREAIQTEKPLSPEALDEHMRAIGLRGDLPRADASARTNHSRSGRINKP